MKWEKLDKWEDLPLGRFLVKVECERHPYQIAYCGENARGDKLIVVGGHFHWDMMAG